MANEAEKQVLRNVLIQNRSMQRWQKFARAKGFVNPKKYADGLALRSLMYFDQTIRVTRNEGKEVNLKAIAKKAVQWADEHDSKSVHKGRMNKPRSDTRYRKSKAVNLNQPARRRRPNTTYPAKNYPPATDNKTEPYRRNYESQLSIPSAPEKSKDYVGRRVETPDYAQYVDEGIGGTREQALNERRKLGRESKYRR